MQKCHANALTLACNTCQPTSQPAQFLRNVNRSLSTFVEAHAQTAASALKLRQAVSTASRN